MKTQSISQNSHLYLQNQPHLADTCRDSFEILQNYLQRTVNLLGQRLFELTRDRADLDQIGKAQRALSGALANFYKILGTLADIQDIEPLVYHDALAYQNPQDLDPERFSVVAPETTTPPESPPDPPRQPATPPEPETEHPQPPQNQTTPETPPPLDLGDDLPPLNPFDDNFEEIAALYEARLQTALNELKSPPNAPETPATPEQSTAPKKLSPPKKYNTRKKRKDQKYLRKLQKRHRKTLTT